MPFIDCGVMDFQAAFLLQERLVAGIAANSEPETLLLMEHPSVYTIGTGGDRANLLDPESTVIRTNRGGDITWHGSGQLVGYPLVNLGERGQDLHCWLRFIEELLIRTVAEFGVEAWRVPGITGVWAARGKLASIGVGVRRWVTMHGFALNIDPDLTQFARINPCGVPGCPVTSLQLERGYSPSLPEVKRMVETIFWELLADCLPITRSRNYRITISRKDLRGNMKNIMPCPVFPLTVRPPRQRCLRHHPHTR